MPDKKDKKYRFNRLSDFEMPEETNTVKKNNPHAVKAEDALKIENVPRTLTLPTEHKQATSNGGDPIQKTVVEPDNIIQFTEKNQADESKQIDFEDSSELSTYDEATDQSFEKEKKTDYVKMPPITGISQNEDGKQKVLRSPQSKHMTINDLPKDEKPREKMLAYGANVLSNAELLAVIIGSGTKSAKESLTAIELSQRILTHFGDDLTELYAASAEELYRDEDLPGIGVAKACKIKSALELGHRAHIPKKPLLKISSSQDAANFLMPDMKNLKQEEFVVLLLDSKNHLFKKERVSKGTVNASLVTPREVFAFAVRQHATGIIVAHNHPSGDPTPSQADKTVTRELVESGKILNIPLLDHIIIGNDYFSFLEEGILY